MKIAHIALGGCLKGFPIAYGLTEDTGGHIAYVLGAAMAQGALRSVADVAILTRLFEGEGVDPVHARPSERIADKVTIRRLATGNRAYLEKGDLARDLDAFTRAALVELERTRPDVVHAHFADAARVAGVVRDRLGIPFAYTPHSLALQKGAGLAGRRVDDERAALAAADAVVVSSRDEIERQVAAYAVPGLERRLHCLPPGPPPCPSADGIGVPSWLAARLAEPKRPMVLAVARPVRRKNLIALVEAFAGEAALRRRANLVILAGQPDRKPPSGEEAAVLAELAGALDDPRLAGIAARAGHHTHAQVQALYREARATGGVFVNPAAHEPFGLTLLEAAAAGLPVVATRNGGPRDIVDAIGHGLLVDPHDRAAIAAACLRVIADGSLHRALSEAALRNAGQFSWSRYAERSATLYARLPRAPVAAKPPRLVVCDIDNTLTGCPAAAARFADWARQHGYVVATGRSLAEARMVLALWRLPEPDAFITDVGTAIHRRGAGGGFESCAAFAAMIDEDWDRAAVAAVAGRLGLLPQHADNQGPHKLSFFATAAEAAAASAAIAAAGLSARVVHSHGHYLDVLAPRAGKGAAVAAYAGGLGLSLADCVAAGDSGNDLDMLDSCGTAIVVGNASDELAGLRPRDGLIRARARHADGVLEGLAKLGLAPRGEGTEGAGLAA